MNPRIHNPAMKMCVAAFLLPSGLVRVGVYPGLRRCGSTLGYISAAAWRLKVLAILPGIT